MKKGIIKKDKALLELANKALNDALADPKWRLRRAEKLIKKLEELDQKRIINAKAVSRAWVRSIDNRFRRGGEIMFGIRTRLRKRKERRLKKELEEFKKLHAAPFTEEQRRRMKEEDNSDIIDFLKMTRAWRESPSSNGKMRLRSCVV